MSDWTCNGHQMSRAHTARQQVTVYAGNAGGVTIFVSDSGQVDRIIQLDQDAALHLVAIITAAAAEAKRAHDFVESIYGAMERGASNG